MEKELNEVLEELFATSPLPNILKSRKARWEAGTLRVGSKISLVENYTDYEVKIICKKSSKKVEK